ncbi:conserved Plasmodium protein, unknown function [Plasmodium gallinaceum]|uniref:Uncharacterized protein n=1 Tax=Plasmodium gallinaceum TaxID=5849 RepID=A0A1J1GUI6_PLAGA|nr:conserved Plasmodium protein, unknown function [Plasmodium gallinaceum]CRG96201.1 conserved Plasmodium protein, unknown function [Plasmodium gallinaceum]
MILLVKIINFSVYYFLIQLYLFKHYICSVKNKNESPLDKNMNLPNGPLDLPLDRKLNIGLRKYKYNLENEEFDNHLHNEMNEDAMKLKDAIDKNSLPREEYENYSTEDELDYNFPPWLVDMIKLSNNSKNTLESLGVENLPDVNLCKQIKHLKEQMICIIEALEDIKEVYENANDITSLTARTLAGGRLAIRALSRLKTLASAVENRQLMKTLGTPMATLILLQRETTSDRNRWLSGSILTLLTDLPVVSDLADIKTGSYGHINVIMPRQSRVRNADRNILKLREGASPSSLINGYTTIQEEYTI